eukprot:COSAG01_NODE_26991_length_697_cov_1.591973_1_plen_220_part_10
MCGTPQQAGDRRVRNAATAGKAARKPPSMSRRLRAVRAHLQQHAAPSARWQGTAAVVEGAAAGGEKVLLTDEEVKTFLINGWHVLPGAHIGLPDALHDSIYDEGMSMLAEARDQNDGGLGQLVAENVTSRIPAMQEVCASPVVSGAIQSLLGEGYALHPHTFLHSTFAGMDQDFHKDGILPWNGHAMRTHQPEYMLVLYYPQVWRSPTNRIYPYIIICHT